MGSKYIKMYIRIIPYRNENFARYRWNTKDILIRSYGCWSSKEYYDWIDKTKNMILRFKDCPLGLSTYKKLEDDILHNDLFVKAPNILYYPLIKYDESSIGLKINTDILSFIPKEKLNVNDRYQVVVELKRKSKGKVKRVERTVYSKEFMVPPEFIKYRR